MVTISIRIVSTCDPTPILTFCSASSVPLPLKGKGLSVGEMSSFHISLNRALLRYGNPTIPTQYCVLAPRSTS